ncbi:uncharacterized protein BP01DRAFT_365574 [Aspergillus saccharolyticus JOP 1030-1]|uniref:Uncharacterized protein n=1 Tax=Aspergillus saccharolyticus JOP 1030-1 TaxID=1450539 RepID=A0A318ZM29_9EURO|nr:hypothetical protein BP01DRAFT_365574 [Aspergillus saccharolyticus JOP 1030-1]PYH45503.1 hypothetical protein BP01DRAFT_365574 [Aspergillus saccharolyticus JOP 1030-1]
MGDLLRKGAKPDARASPMNDYHIIRSDAERQWGACMDFGPIPRGYHYRVIGMCHMSFVIFDRDEESYSQVFNDRGIHGHLGRPESCYGEALPKNLQRRLDICGKRTVSAGWVNLRMVFERDSGSTSAAGDGFATVVDLVDLEVEEALRGGGSRR